MSKSKKDLPVPEKKKTINTRDLNLDQKETK